MVFVIYSIIAVFVFGLDMLTKYLAVKTNVNLIVIPNFLKFKLSYNTGAAFSFLGDKPWAIKVFAIFTILVLIGIITLMVFAILKKKRVSKWFAVALSLVFGGALGNLVDRLWLKKVRDFIFVFYNTNIFPAIFNVADIALVVGVIMICVYLLFLDKDAVFRFKKVEQNNGKEDNNG